MVKYWLSSALALSSFVCSAWGISTDQCQPSIRTEVSILKFIDRPAEDTRSVYIEGYYAYNTTIRVDPVNSLQVTCAPCSVNSWVTFAASTITPTTYTYCPVCANGLTITVQSSFSSGTNLLSGSTSSFISNSSSSSVTISSGTALSSTAPGPASSLAALSAAVSSAAASSAATSSVVAPSTATSSVVAPSTAASSVVASPSNSPTPLFTGVSGAVASIDQQFFLAVSAQGPQKRADTDQNFLTYTGALGNISDAAYFGLTDGELYSNGLQVSVNLNSTSALIAGSDVVGDISKGFALSNNSLIWENETFTSNQAFFGLDSSNLLRASPNGAIPSTWRSVVVSAYGVPADAWNSTSDNVGSNYLVTPLGYRPALVQFSGSSTYSNSSNGTVSAAAVSTASYEFPPGLENFGGVDVTQKQGFGHQTGLWNFDGTFITRTVDFTPVTSPVTKSKRALSRRTKETYKIPSFLAFDSVSTFERADISSETRESYQQSLSTTFGLSEGAFGFSAEMSDSFQSSTKTETYKKYAGSYTIAKMYGVKLSSSNPTVLRKSLSDEAVALFASGTAAEIVERFGTHYMNTAVFGGWKRTTHELDVRDSEVATAHTTALQIKVAIKDPEIGDPKFGTNYSNTDENTRKISTTLDTSYTTCLGGTAYLCDIETNSLTWLSSLPGNPGIPGHTLVALDNLIIDSVDGQGKKAAVAAKIQEILASQALTKARALVIYKPMTHASDDAGSKARDSISTATVNADDGWFSLGHYAQGPGPTSQFRNNPSQFLGIQIQESPSVQNASKGSIIQKPTGLYRTWGMRSRGGFGIYEMTGPAGFASLSAIFKRSDSASLNDFGSAAMLSTSILKPATGYTQLWTDRKSGARDDGSAWGVQGPDDGSNTPMSKTPTNTVGAYLFHGASSYNQPGVKGWQLDFSQIAVVADKFLAGIPLPKNA